MTCVACVTFTCSRRSNHQGQIAVGIAAMEMVMVIVSVSVSERPCEGLLAYLLMLLMQVTGHAPMANGVLALVCAALAVFAVPAV